jgi:hypothetical protein
MKAISLNASSKIDTQQTVAQKVASAAYQGQHKANERTACGKRVKNQGHAKPQISLIPN